MCRQAEESESKDDVITKYQIVFYKPVEKYNKKSFSNPDTESAWFRVQILMPFGHTPKSIHVSNYLYNSINAFQDDDKKILSLEMFKLGNRNDTFGMWTRIRVGKINAKKF